MTESLPPDGRAPDPTNPARKPDPRNLRTRIAAAVERHPAFRTLLDGGAPRLLNPRIAGPLTKDGRGGQYCVSIRFETSITRIAVVGDAPTADGGSALTLELIMPEASVFAREPDECTNRYQPFPELEQLRTKRRAEQGKSA